MEYFKLTTSYGAPKGRVPVLDDDYETALEKAITRAKSKVSPVSDIIITHVIEDRHSEESREVKTIGRTDKPTIRWAEDSSNRKQFAYDRQNNNRRGQ